MRSSRRWATHLRLVSRAHLQERLKVAISNEQFEDAAIIRDELAYRDRNGEPEVVARLCLHDDDGN